MDFKYPYTDFHELNLDWFLAEFKKLTADWLQIKQDWADEQQAFQDLKDYVDNYFANLDLYQEVHDILWSPEMQGNIQIILSNLTTNMLPGVVADQITAVVASQISTVVALQLPAVVVDKLPAALPAAVAGEAAAWLEAHVDPDTGYVIDDTLSIALAAADAKAVGDRTTAIETKLNNDSIFGYSVSQDISAYVTTGYQINCHNKQTTANAPYEYAEYPIIPGQKYRIKGYAYSNNSSWRPHVWGSNSYIEYFQVTAGSPFDITFTAPAEAVSVIFNGLTATYPCEVELYNYSQQVIEFNQDIAAMKAELTAQAFDVFNIENLERRVLHCEHNNDFRWSAFDKSLFVFIHDDTNAHLEEYAAVFLAKNAPMCEAAIIENIDATHLATMQSLVNAGGEVLAHYNASPVESSPDSLWLECTRDVKYALQNMGFNVRGIIRANDTGTETNKGEKYCRLYFDYANDKMGKSIQYDLPRTLISHWNSEAALKAYIDTAAQTPGIYAFGFHGYSRASESWFDTTVAGNIIDYINSKANCEITTYSNIYDAYGSCDLNERLKVLES